MCLHAQQEAVLAGSDDAAEIAQFLTARRLDPAHRAGDPLAHPRALIFNHGLEIAHWCGPGIALRLGKPRCPLGWGLLRLCRNVGAGREE